MGKVFEEIATKRDEKWNVFAGEIIDLGLIHDIIAFDD
jgi:hypothetical protein